MNNFGQSLKEPSNLTRHDFLRLAIQFMVGLGGLIGLGGLVRFFSYQFDPDAPSEFDLGPASNFTVGSRTIRADIPAAIDNQAGEIIAYSLTCTHLGCTVETDGEAFICPCHGSRFKTDGSQIRGPAQKPLRRLQVELLEDETLKLYTDRGKP